MRIAIMLLLTLTALTACTDEAKPSNSTPTTIGPTPTHNPNAAPSHADIQDEVDRIWSEDKKIQDPELRYNRARDYLATLHDKTVEGWQAWVYSVYRKDGEDGLRASVVYDNPYTKGATTKRRDWDSVRADFALSGLHPEESQRLKIGQEIIFSGTIQDTWHDMRIEVSKLELVEGNEATPAVPEDISDLTLSLERSICYGTCPEYKVLVKGDGTVEYFGSQFVGVAGEQTSTISLDKVRDLIGEFLKVDYFALNDEYVSYDVTDGPYITTSIAIGGKTKSIRHYQGDLSAPIKLTLLEDRIDEIINSSQWVTQKDDPTVTP